jgi:hypothetical protein
MDLKVSQQVVLRRKVNRSGPTTSEIRVGTILAFSPDGKKATLSIPGPGGKISRASVFVDTLEPVSDRFKRASVHFNPAFRNIASV